MRRSVFILGVFVAVICADAEAAKLSVGQIMAQLGHR
jgi:hypothetical protein